MKENFITDPLTTYSSPTKLLMPISMMWVTILTVVVFSSMKTFNIGPFTTACVTLVYPLTYIFSDIFTEIYGYRTSRKIVWTGFICLATASLFGYIFAVIPGDPTFAFQKEFETIFKMSPLITLATIAGFFFGDLGNSIFLAKAKIWTKGSKPWLRFIGSTMVGQTIDNTLAASLFVLFGIIPVEIGVVATITAIVVCVSWEIVASPITHKVIRKIKQIEGMDTYDHGTNFNPFHFKNETDCSFFSSAFISTCLPYCSAKR